MPIIEKKNGKNGRKAVNYGYNGNVTKVLHPSDETIFSAAKDEIGRYMELKLKERVFGQKVSFSPLFISHSIKFMNSLDISVTDGKIIDDDIERSAKVRTAVLVGERNRGGFNYNTHNSIPLEEDYDSLRGTLWLVTSAAIEEAYRRYSTRIGDIGKAKREFDVLSREKPVVDIGSDEGCDIDLNSIVQAVEKATSVTSRYREISGMTGDISIKRVLHYFTSSEGTRIKTSNLYISIRFEPTCYDKYGSLSYLKTFTKRKYSQLNLDAIGNCGDWLVKALLKVRSCRRQEAGTYPALIDGVTHGVVWHEAIGHLLEKNPLEEDYESETFKGKLGKRIAPSFLNLQCDPTLKDRYGSYKYDDEGIPGQKVTLIKNGVLKNFLHSRLTAGREGKRSNGHSRAQEDEDEAPIPRMSNLVVYPSKGMRLESLKAQLIQLAKKAGKRYGILCKGYTHGQVDPESGQNETHPLETFRVYTDGRIERVKDIYIIGTPYTLINQIVACGKTAKSSEGYCFSDSGAIPVEEIAPHALLTSVEFGREKKRNERAPFLPKP